MKKIAIMQPYFFPYIGYWQLINAVDEFIIFDDVNFIKKGFINRNFILSFNKKEPLRFTLELKKASQNKLINEIELGCNQEKLLNIVNDIYKKAPYFSEVFPLIENVLLYEEKNLSLFLGNIIQTFVNYLDIKTKLIYSSQIEKNNYLKGQDKVIDIVKKLQGNIYINSIGGIELYNKADFEKEDIELKFLKPSLEEIKYKQFDKEFVSNLSIIDVMMFNDKQTIKEFLKRYELI